MVLHRSFYETILTLLGSFKYVQLLVMTGCKGKKCYSYVLIEKQPPICHRRNVTNMDLRVKFWAKRVPIAMPYD